MGFIHLADPYRDEIPRELMRIMRRSLRRLEEADAALDRDESAPLQIDASLDAPPGAVGGGPARTDGPNGVRCASEL